MRAFLPAACVLAASFAGIGSWPASAEDASVAAHSAVWRARSVLSYRYGYNKYCECNGESPPETVVTVENGAVVEVHHVHPDSPREVPAREGSLDLYWTVEGLFDLIESATQRGAVVRASYDSTLGYPRRIYIDYDENFVGDELDLRLTYLEILE